MKSNRSILSDKISSTMLREAAETLIKLTNLAWVIDEEHRSLFASMTLPYQDTGRICVTLGAYGIDPLTPNQDHLEFLISHPLVIQALANLAKYQMPKLGDLDLHMAAGVMKEIKGLDVTYGRYTVKATVREEIKSDTDVEKLNSEWKAKITEKYNFIIFSDGSFFKGNVNFKSIDTFGNFSYIRTDIADNNPTFSLFTKSHEKQHLCFVIAHPLELMEFSRIFYARGLAKKLIYFESGRRHEKSFYLPTEVAALIYYYILQINLYEHRSGNPNFEKLIALLPLLWEFDRLPSPSLTVLPNSQAARLKLELDTSCDHSIIKQTFPKGIDSKKNTITMLSTSGPSLISGGICVAPLSTQTAVLTYGNQNFKPLVTIFADNYAPDEGMSNGKGSQAAQLIDSSNASYAMPIDYEYGIVESFGGFYLLSDVSLKCENEKIYPCDFLFLPIPDLRDAEDSEKDFFNRETYLTHVTLLILMQFNMAKLTGQPLITGRQGCDDFNNKDEDVAAIFHVISTLPEFQKVAVMFALGETASPELINLYKNPPKENCNEVQDCIARLSGENINLNDLEPLSKNLVEKFLLRKYIFFQPEVKELCQLINDTLIKQLNEGMATLFGGYLLSSEAKEKNEKIKNFKITCLNRLKDSIEKKIHIYSFDEIINRWLRLPLTNKPTFITANNVKELLLTNGDGKMVEMTPIYKTLTEWVKALNPEKPNPVASLKK